ncbi:AbrB/MazE/SpoVT family DNA-binding domain-containing protein, partial [Candidatus Woesearchaeota archaeon]|nr:AbrB/MazE/SpoVT family DNA-binding domain-containing protein [Candidatus Woesearchaeota archaeon]
MAKMISCEAKVKKWGSSMAVIIPKTMAKKEGLKVNDKIRLMVNKPN